MIEKSDIPGATLIGSLLGIIGDIILFGGDVIVASVGAILSSIELFATGIQLIGRAGEESGLLAQSAADQLVLIGVILLLGGISWRAIRVISRDVQKRIQS